MTPTEPPNPSATETAVSAQPVQDVDSSATLNYNRVIEVIFHFERHALIEANIPAPKAEKCQKLTVPTL